MDNSIQPSKYKGLWLWITTFGEAVTGENLSQQTESSCFPNAETPNKKMKKEAVVAEISKILDDGEQSMAAISEKKWQLKHQTRRVLKRYRKLGGISDTPKKVRVHNITAFRGYIQVRNP